MAIYVGNVNYKYKEVEKITINLTKHLERMHHACSDHFLLYLATGKLLD